MPVATPYHAPRWLRGAHAQTIWPLLLKRPPPPLQRECWDSPDGDVLAVDLLPHRPGAPLVILFHGLEGSSRSHYSSALLHALHQQGWNGAVPHFRGCGGQPNRLLRAYHSGDADEIDWLLHRFALRYPNAPRYAAGVSLGGNALLLWLGTRGPQAAALINAAAAISAPLDLAACGHQLAQGFNRLYTRNFLKTLKRHAQAKLRRYPGSFDAHRLRTAHTLYAFDDVYTAPIHGYANADDYWRRASARPWLPRIHLPTLILNAHNDPFMPPAILPTAADTSPSVCLEQPAQGGHVGFVSGPFPGHLDWLPQRLLHFFMHGS